ncbi:hypothetical protein MKW98_005939 [Papaver atlanticum]|uniref:Structural polyprotein n=1 Tax=Papaver atlanticum TaxID=357466 RepID=A0AAD4XV88_9MAGN|nr:hypothetical protein MKW98_005939 [Papaver atlanticum]
MVPSPNSPLILSFQALFLIISRSSLYTHATTPQSIETGGTRSLLSLKETPGGSNATFECSPSGPCLPCLYSEKGDEKYRCSETGYRIPLKCIGAGDGSKKKTGKKSKKSRSTLEKSIGNTDKHSIMLDTEETASSIKSRRVLDDSSTSDGRQSYITYRSCVPAVNQEKLSVLGFEAIMLFMVLCAGSLIYFRRKQVVTMPGVGMMRVPSNSRF